MITCTKCKEKKNESAFYPSQQGTKQFSSWCKECMATKIRDCYLKRTYGIDSIQYQEMLDAQDGGCGICGKANDSILKKTSKNKKLAVDHDQMTGEVRGILCENCNRGIGLFQHDTDLLQKAIGYLNQF